MTGKKGIRKGNDGIDSINSVRLWLLWKRRRTKAYYYGLRNAISAGQMDISILHLNFQP